MDVRILRHYLGCGVISKTFKDKNTFNFMHTSTNILEDNVRATQHAGISTSVSIYRTIMA